MSFCPTCDTLLDFVEEENGTLVTKCPDCDYEEQNDRAYNNLILSESIEHTEKDRIEVIDHSLQNNMTTGITEEIRSELQEMYRESMSATD